MRLIRLVPEDECLRLLDAVRRLPFGDGSDTAKGSSRLVKRNTQALADDPLTVSLVAQMQDVMLANPTFVRTAFPRRFGRVTFSRYGFGDHYGEHVDLPFMGRPGADTRTDMSFTLFLSPPDTYSGGELVLQTGAGPIEVKLPSGMMVLYETSLVHSVRVVTAGERHVMIGWVESHVGSNELRSLAASAYDLCDEIGIGGVGYSTADRLAQGLLRLGAQG